MKLQQKPALPFIKSSRGSKGTRFTILDCVTIPPTKHILNKPPNKILSVSSAQNSPSERLLATCNRQCAVWQRFSCGSGLRITGVCMNRSIRRVDLHKLSLVHLMVLCDFTEGDSGLSKQAFLRVELGSQRVQKVKVLEKLIWPNFGSHGLALFCKVLHWLHSSARVRLCVFGGLCARAHAHARSVCVCVCVCVCQALFQRVTHEGLEAKTHSRG